MQKKLLPLAEQYAKQNKQQSIWRKIVQVMACGVVFCTTYALILPAITMERQACELEEHTHADSCYSKLTTRQITYLSCSEETLGVHEHTPECRDADQRIMCGYADFVVHEHNTSCYDEDGILVCPLPEFKEHEHTEQCYQSEETVPQVQDHVHDDSCYTVRLGELVCNLSEAEAHAHTDVCRTQGELICGQEEVEGHTHDETCGETVLACELTVEPHVHGEGCWHQLQCGLPEEPGHTHGEACSETVLVCGLTMEPHVHTDACWHPQQCQLPEDENHTHSESCSGPVLSCDLTEQPHVHTGGCYQSNLVCTVPEGGGHTHGESCSGSVLTCDLKEQPHVHTETCYQTNYLCNLSESQGHTHSAVCYEWVLSCTDPEVEGHTHEDACYEQIEELICTLEDTVSEEKTVPAESPVRELICEEEEIRLHTHDDGCCETYLDVNGEEQKRLTCQELMVEEHVHSEGCFVTEEVPVEDADTLTCGLEETGGHEHADTCYDETGALICTAQTEAHAHTERCYGTWVLICGKEEHTHNEECMPEPEVTYYCGHEEHTHSEACEDEEGNLICALEEHVHSEECMQEQTLSEEDRAAVEAVEALIDAIPSQEEISQKLFEFYQANDIEGEIAYNEALYAQVEEAYRAYMALSEEQREYVSNADRLMELEYIWSRVTMEAALSNVNQNSVWTGNLTDGEYITDEVTYQFSNNAVVTLNGTIVIGNGGKLTILGSGSIVRGDSNTDQPLIVVLEGGELVIGDTSPSNTSTRKDNFVIDGRSIVVDASTTTDIITNMNRRGWGAAIYSNGKVTLVNTTVQNNKNRRAITKDDKAVIDSYGGGLYIAATGSLSLDRCAILRNTAGVFGGGFHSYGPVTAKDTEIAYNRAMTTEYGLNENKGGMINYGRGGGFCLSSATAIATFDNVDIHDNACMYYGGGGQVDSKAVLTMNSGSFRNNTALLHGAGGLHLTGDATFIMNGGSITGNTCYYVGGGIHTSYGTVLQLNGGEISNNIAYGRGGGIHIDCGSELLLDGTNITGNKALSLSQRRTSAQVDATGDNWSNIGCVGGIAEKGIGGGVLVDCGTCTMSAGTLSGNYADHAGGGIGLVMIIVGSGSRISYNEVASINLVGGTISNNTTNGNGAGIYLMKNAFGELSQEDLDIKDNPELMEIYNRLKQDIPYFTASGGTMRNNVAQNDGGGAYQETGTEFTITGTALFEENQAIRNGGAVYIDQGTAEISGGAMNNNTAGESGGALYINGTVTMSNGNVTNNTAKNAGGIYVAGGNVIMTNGKVTGNTASENGGAVYVANTSVTFGAEDGAIEVANNSAKNGAGFYLNQSGGAYTTTISNGQITDNTATGNGGGIYQTGTSAVCTMGGGGSVSRNKAANGGGFYIHSGAMNVNGGYVVSNEAVGTSPNTTAYTSSANSGVGGGIYLNSGSYTMTAATGDVGLYGNIAGFAADDVYAAPSGTKLTIPEVANMNLTNFGQAVGTVTDWFEDYAAKDSRYSDGLNGGKFADGSADIMRYRLADNDHKVANKITSATNRYICLTLGYEMDYTPITVKKIVTSYDGTYTTDQEFRFAIEHNDGIHGIVTTERSLRHNEETTVNDVLRNSTVTVTELNPDGYAVSVQVLDRDGNVIKSALGNTITVENQEGIQFVFTNHAGYELPETGAAGTTSYTMGGLLLMAAAILLYSHNLKRRKEEQPSF